MLQHVFDTRSRKWVVSILKRPIQDGAFPTLLYIYRQKRHLWPWVVYGAYGKFDYDRLWYD